MTRRAMPWPDRARSFIGHCLSEPLYRLFSLVPHWEVGLSTHEISRLTYVDRMLAGRRVVHLSDLHLDRYQPQHDLVVAAIGELRPDWIFITGDLLNVPEGLPHLFRFLARLREIAPVFVTLGNHIGPTYAVCPRPRRIASSSCWLMRRTSSISWRNTTPSISSSVDTVTGVSGAYREYRRFGSRQAATAGSRGTMESTAAGYISIVASDGRLFLCDGIAHRRSLVSIGATQRVLPDHS